MRQFHCSPGNVPVLPLPSFHTSFATAIASRQSFAPSTCLPLSPGGPSRTHRTKSRLCVCLCLKQIRFAKLIARRRQHDLLGAESPIDWVWWCIFPAAKAGPVRAQTGPRENYPASLPAQPSPAPLVSHSLQSMDLCATVKRFESATGPFLYVTAHLDCIQRSPSFASLASHQPEGPWHWLSKAIIFHNLTVVRLNKYVASQQININRCSAHLRSCAIFVSRWIHFFAHTHTHWHAWYCT